MPGKKKEEKTSGWKKDEAEKNDVCRRWYSSFYTGCKSDRCQIERLIGNFYTSFDTCVQPEITVEKMVQVQARD